jgi:hypothetical protein
MSTVNVHREEIAYNVGDPMLDKIKEETLLVFINRAARDVINSGWLLPQEYAENVELIQNQFEYDVPARFAFIQMIRIGDATADNAATVDSGTNTAEALDATETDVEVVDASIFAVNDLIQVDSEIMLVTAVDTSTDILTVTRGYFSTTAATHDTATDVERPHSNTAFDYIIPRAYWRLKLQTGGANTTTAALGSRPQIVFDSVLFSFTGGTPLQIVGQKRPSVYTQGSDTLDAQMESFIVERATAYAARFLFAQGDHPHLNQVYHDSMNNSAAFLVRHPAEFRVKPSSTRVPGR